jgi:long-chain acyl-CoA synthetase
LGKIRRHLLPGIYDEAKQTGSIAGQAAGPMSIEEMSNEDQALLDNSTARQVWEWLSARYPDLRLTPDTSPQLDLGIDSLEWLNLTLEIRERAGVELGEAAIGRVETIRDLLQEVAEASEAGAQPQVDPLEQPEEVLSEQQKQWLKPLGPVRSALARVLFGLNRLLMRRLFRLQVEGQEYIPTHSQFILAPNHVSYLDPFAVAAALDYSQLRQTYWGGWTGVVASNPINRFFVRLGQAVPIDPKRAVISSLAFGAAVLKQQKNLILFPEGRRSTTGELEPFKAGIGLLLEKFQTPVIPVFIDGTNEALPPGQFLPRFKKITVKFGNPLNPADLEREGEGEQPQHRIAQALHDHVARLGNVNHHSPLAKERPSLIKTGRFRTQEDDNYEYNNNAQN